MMITSSFPNSDSNNSQHTHSNTIADTRVSMQQETISIFSLKNSENNSFVERELEEKESEYQMIAKVPNKESQQDSDQESLSLQVMTNDQESEQVSVIDERKTRSSTIERRKKINQDNHDSSSQSSSIDTEDQDEALSIASIPRQSTRPRRSSISRQPSTQSTLDTKAEKSFSASGRKITLRHSKLRGSLSSVNSASTSNIASDSKALATDGRISQQLKKKINEKQPPNTINLGKLDVSSLKKYRRAYKLRINSGSTRLQLLQAIQDHHQGIKVDEFDVVSRFLDRVKSENSRTSPMKQSVSQGKINLNGKVLGLHSSQSGK